MHITCRLEGVGIMLYVACMPRLAMPGTTCPPMRENGIETLAYVLRALSQIPVQEAVRSEREEEEEGQRVCAMGQGYCLTCPMRRAEVEDEMYVKAVHA